MLEKGLDWTSPTLKTAKVVSGVQAVSGSTPLVWGRKSGLFSNALFELRGIEKAGESGAAGGEVLWISIFSTENNSCHPQHIAAMLENKDIVFILLIHYVRRVGERGSICVIDLCSSTECTPHVLISSFHSVHTSHLTHTFVTPRSWSSVARWPREAAPLRTPGG